MGDPAKVDYEQLFSQIESAGKVPYASSETIDPQHGVFQGMYLDLSEIQARLAASKLEPPLVTVYADVLNVPAATSWPATGPALYLVARRLQVDGQAQIDLDHGVDAVATFVLFCDEVAGELTVEAAYPGQDPTSFPIAAAPEKGGVQIGFASSGPVATARTSAQGMTDPPAGTFQQALITEFIFASLLMDGEPAIAIAQLDWIKHWAAESPALLGLFYRSGSLLALLTAQLNAKANGAAFVPYLERTVYADLAGKFAAEAATLEAEYRALSTQKVVDEQFIAQAKALLKNQASQGEYVKKLLAQAESNYDNAVAAVEAAQAKFKDAQSAAKIAESDFLTVGVPAWEEEKIIEAVISLGAAIISFGVSIAAVLEGGGAGAAQGAGAAVASVEQVKDAAAAGSELAKRAEQLEKALTALKKMIETLSAVYSFAQGIARAAREIGNAQGIANELEGINLSSGGTDLTATYQWDVYRTAADAAIAGPIQQGVRYAEELKLAVDDVAIYGQALAAAQLAAITASQSYAAVAWQVQLGREQQQTLETYVASLEVGEQPLAAMMQQFYQRYIDAKSSVLAAIEDYRASFYYWALEQSKTQVSLIEQVRGLEAGLGALTATELDEAEALERFAPPPQEVASVKVAIEDPVVLAALRSNGIASWTIGLDQAFEGFDRVRLDCVRVWIEGAKPKPSSPVTVVMTTTGTYLDRLGGSRFQFMAKPLERTFAYEVTSHSKDPAWEFEDGSFGLVEIDGRVDAEVAYAYFRPTPFASWSISLENHNQGIDLSGVSRITMDFAGSAIGESA